MKQDVSSDIVFTPDVIALCNRLRAHMVQRRVIVRDAVKELIDRDIMELNELQCAIAAQLEANGEDE